jgi:tetratricopeptide (TPR) repeat protein
LILAGTLCTLAAADPTIPEPPSGAPQPPSASSQAPANTPAPAPASAPATNAAPAKPVDPVILKLNEAYGHLRNGELDAAVASATDILKTHPTNRDALLLRGSIYANQKKFADAQTDYDAALAAEPNNPIIKFDEGELHFLQKDYDAARTRFAALQTDPELGDLASYKVFLCDLFGSHEDQAKKELDAFNQVGGNPSYYFANAAWDLFHNNTDDAKGWLTSAANIYSDNPQKLANYASSLRSLGYLPIKSTASQ